MTTLVSDACAAPRVCTLEIVRSTTSKHVHLVRSTSVPRPGAPRCCALRGCGARDEEQRSDAEKCLTNLNPAYQRVGFINDASRIVGQARTFLEFHQPDDLLAELPEHMDRVQRACAQASDAVTRTYFAQPIDLSWVGEVS